MRPNEEQRTPKNCPDFGEVYYSPKETKAWALRPTYNYPQSYFLNLKDLWLQGVLAETNIYNKFFNLSRLWFAGYLPILFIYGILCCLPQWIITDGLITQGPIFWLNCIFLSPLLGAAVLLMALMSPFLFPIYLHSGTTTLSKEADQCGVAFVGTAIIILFIGWLIKWGITKLYKKLDERYCQYRGPSRYEGFNEAYYSNQFAEVQRFKKLKEQINEKR